jgi:hypothetical protein
VSVKYATEEQIKNGVIIHYHGMKHCVDYPLCEMWKKEYLEVVEKFAVRELRMNWEDKRLGRFQREKGIFIEQAVLPDSNKPTETNSQPQLIVPTLRS